MGPGYERDHLELVNNNTSQFYSSQVAQSSDHAFDFRVYSAQNTAHDPFKPHQMVCYAETGVSIWQLRFLSVA